MKRVPTLLPAIVIVSVLLSGCLEIGLPFVTSTDPFYPEDDPGVALPEHVTEGGWMAEGMEQLMIEQDPLGGRPCDYILTFTKPPLPPEPQPEDEEQIEKKPRDPNDAKNNERLQVHFFEVNGVTYADITTLQMIAEPEPDQPMTRGRKGKDGHILARVEVGLNQIAFQLMDQQWFNKHVAANPGELKTTLPEPEPDIPNNPMIRDSQANIAAFLQRHENSPLWGPAIVFNRGE